MTDRFNTRRRGAVASTSWMALGLVLAFGPSVAAAQTVPATPPTTSGSAVEDDSQAEEVIVVGSRASQQSANQRKKDARTATDKLELEVGRDLQFIRINGTLVGGLIGLGLHLVSRAIG